MGKSIAPLLSLTADGAFKKTIIFSRGKGISRVKIYAKPRARIDQKTPAQLSAREDFTICFNLWQSFSPAEKIAFINKAKYKSMSGFNLHMKECIESHPAGALPNWELPFNLDDGNTSA